MKRWLENSKRAISAWSIALEDYFLGPSLPLGLNSCIKGSFLGQEFTQKLLLVLNDDDNQNILSPLTLKDEDNPPLIILVMPAEVLEEQEYREATSRTDVVIMRPYYLEMVVPMVKKILSHISGAIILLLHHLSRIPC